MTAHSLGLVGKHDHPLPWPGTYALLLTLLAWLLCITAHSLDMALKDDSSLSWPGSYKSLLTLFAWHL